MCEITHDQRLDRLIHLLNPGGKRVRAWQLTGGLSARMIAFEIRLPDGQTQKLILRQPGAATLTQNPDAAADEYRLLHVLKSAGIAAPAPHYLDPSPPPCLVIEYVEGEPQYAPADVVDFACQLAAQLARIHSINGAELSFLPRQAGIAQWAANRPDHAGSPEQQRIRSILHAAGALPSLNPPALLHGDFWQGNVLWNDGMLAAVVDWEDAAIGDPLSDFAISRLDLCMICGADAMTAFTRHYQSLVSIDFAHLPYWDLCAALRAAPNLALWASGFPDLGRPDITEPSMRNALTWFVDQAVANL